MLHNRPKASYGAKQSVETDLTVSSNIPVILFLNFQNTLSNCLNIDVRCLDVKWIDEIFKIMKISELSDHLIYPSKYLKSNHLNKNINMKFKQLLSVPHILKPE